LALSSTVPWIVVVSRALVAGQELAPGVPEHTHCTRSVTISPLIAHFSPVGQTALI
jgi:hypothetical protein